MSDEVKVEVKDDVPEVSLYVNVKFTVNSSTDVYTVMFEVKGVKNADNSVVIENAKIQTTGQLFDFIKNEQFLKCLDADGHHMMLRTSIIDTMRVIEVIVK